MAKTERRRRFLAVGSVCVLIALEGCAGNRGATEAQLAAGRRAAPSGAQVYSRECASCHGDRGEGPGVVPALLGPGTLPLHGHNGRTGPFGTAADLFGYLKKKMPLPKKKAGSLSDAQYWAVVNYLLAVRGDKLPPGGITAQNAGTVAIQVSHRR